jgi:hypothetical protein
MMKVRILQQGFAAFDNAAAAAMLLAGAAFVLSGCETAPMRTELALPPPAFVPSGENEALMTISYASDIAAIEPAAGNVQHILSVSDAARDESCLRVGLDGGDALFYQWGGNRLGLDVGSRSEFGFGEATLRYSFSLQKTRAASCTGGGLMDDIRASLDQ